MEKEDSRLLRFFKKIGGTIFGLKKLPKTMKEIRMESKPKNIYSRSKERKIPNFLNDFFRKRHAGWPEYVILKAQIAIILLFGISTTVVLFDSSLLIFGPIMIILTIYLILIAKSELKKAFICDFSAYRSFIGICVSLAWGAVFLLEYFPPIFSSNLLRILFPIVIVILGAVFAFVAFRVRYGRDYTYGIIQDLKGEKAKVKIGYDLRSNVKQGIYFLDSYVPVSKGDVVEVKVDRSTLGLRGSKAEAIVERIEKK